MLALLLITVAFRIQALAGRTLLSAAGEKASIVWPLLGLILAGLIAYAMVLPQAGIIGAAAVTVALSLATALLSVRDGLRLFGVRYPWATFGRVLVAMAATAGASQWIRTFGLHVLLELSLATALYGILLIVLREIRPTQRHLRFVLDRVNFNDKSKP